MIENAVETIVDYIIGISAMIRGIFFLFTAYKTYSMLRIVWADKYSIIYQASLQRLLSLCMSDNEIYFSTLCKHDMRCLFHCGIILLRNQNMTNNQLNYGRRIDRATDDICACDARQMHCSDTPFLHNANKPRSRCDAKRETNCDHLPMQLHVSMCSSVITRMWMTMW